MLLCKHTRRREREKTQQSRELIMHNLNRSRLLNVNDKNARLINLCAIAISLSRGLRSRTSILSSTPERLITDDKVVCFWPFQHISRVIQVKTHVRLQMRTYFLADFSILSSREQKFAFV
jgi:hypothetical protein